MESPEVINRTRPRTQRLVLGFQTWKKISGETVPMIRTISGTLELGDPTFSPLELNSVNKTIQAPLLRTKGSFLNVLKSVSTETAIRKTMAPKK